jgi:hypothetical protein
VSENDWTLGAVALNTFFLRGFQAECQLLFRKDFVWLGCIVALRAIPRSLIWRS